MFTIKHEVCHYGPEGRWDVIESVTTDDHREAERVAAAMARTVIAADDERFCGPGTPINNVISITYTEERTDDEGGAA